MIFFIFLYQRWIYRVDPSRLNEFGVSQEMLEARQQNGAVNPAESTPAVEAATPEPAKTQEQKKNE